MNCPAYIIRHSALKGLTLGAGASLLGPLVLSAKHPEKVQQLRKRLEAYRAAAVPPNAEDEPSNYKAPRVWGPWHR